MRLTLKILGCGTSTGVPVPACECTVCTSGDPHNSRMKPSALLSTENGVNILIDTSTDLRHQALRFGIRKLDAVIFTHYHSDHILGLEDLRGFNFKQKAKIPCYGTRETLTEIKRCFNYIFTPDPRYQGGGVPQLELIEIDGLSPFKVAGIDIQPFPLPHGGISVTGFRIGDIAYATDCKALTPEAEKALTGISTLVLDGLRYEDHSAHLTIPESIEIAQRLKIPCTYLTHMTHTVDYHTVSAALPKNIKLAFDGLSIEGSVKL